MADQTPHIEATHSETGSLAPEYFERLYAERPDPWDFASSAYEAAKYAATLAALPRPLYASALELGCSIGVLTFQLAKRCQRLLATEVNAAALQAANERCRDLEHVRFEQRDLAVSFPSGPFDLIVVSEVAYYFSLADLQKLRSRIAAELAPRGHLILVHYTGETNYPTTADQVHTFFSEYVGRAWTMLKAETAERYRLNLYEAISR